MPLLDFLRHTATITAEAPDGQVPPQDALGGADRSDANWVTIAQGVPCLVSPRGSSLDRSILDSRENLIEATIYFAPDPIARGLTTRHRVTVTAPGRPDPILIGVYTPTGVNDPNYLGILIEVDAERIRS